MNDAASKLAPTLEQRISQALADAGIASADLAALVQETESAIVVADQAAAKERERAHDPALSPDPASAERTKALDPVLSPDAKAAREAMAAAEFARERLRSVLPRLQGRLQKVQAAEYAARWEADFEQVEARRNELVQEYAATYPRLVAQLVDLFERIEAADKEVSRINGSAPSCEHRRLRQVELVARGLKAFSRSAPAISKTVQLCDWADSERLIWPPRQPTIAALYALSMVPPHDARYTADWAAAQKEDNVRRAANEARWAEQEAVRQAESKSAYEASLRR